MPGNSRFGSHLTVLSLRQGKNTRGSGANLPPKCQKEPPKICIEFNANQIKECYFHASKLKKYVMFYCIASFTTITVSQTSSSALLKNSGSFKVV